MLNPSDDMKKTMSAASANGDDVLQGQSSVSNHDGLRRRIGNRQVQLFAIGGSIGTALFVSIGSTLYKSGPISLLLAFIIYCCILAMVNNSVAEMGVLMPISGGFVRWAGKWVDEALGFSAGLNFFLYEAISIPFEIAALNVVLGFWRDDIPVAAVCAACIVTYFLINILASKYYGETEFWLSSGKVILVLILFCFTFITMVGGNPQHDAYGFRHWKNPGPFAEWRTTGSLGKFEGFLAAMWFSPLLIVGPEYVSMIAAEAIYPRYTIKNAFKTIYWRFGFFFIGSALCVGLIVPYNDPVLANLVVGDGTGSGTAAASPYVVAMNNLGIGVLPHVVNALLFTSIYSAGNTYVFCATRNLYSLALEGQAPRILARCTRQGVPIYSLIVTMVFPCLAFLQVSNSSAVVLDWLINLLTSGGLVNYIIMCITYLRFYKACKAQNVDRKTLPYCGWFQPYGTWIALCFLVMIALCNGYTLFVNADESFTAAGFFTKYTMIIISPVAFLGWKLIARSKVVPSAEVDLVWERPLVDAYEDSLEYKPRKFMVEVKKLVLRRPWGEKQETEA